MWNIINSIIIFVEVVLLLFFIIGKIFKKKYSKSWIYLVIILLVNLSIYSEIYLQDIIINNAKHNYFIMIIDIILNSVKLFVGSFKYEEIKKMLPTDNLTMYAFGLSVILSISGTISVFVELFSSKIINYFRVNNRLKKSSCDIIIGSSDEALSYALKNDSCVILVNKDFEKTEYISLIEKGYAILKSDLNLNLLSKRKFNDKSNYNFISLSDDFSFFNLANLFIKYYSSCDKIHNLKLFARVEDDKIDTLKREIIEKQKCESFIEIFSTNDLLVRDFIEKEPLTKHLPSSFINSDTSINKDKKINVFMLGFNVLSEKILKEHIINNQFVIFDEDEYKNFLVNYKVYLDEKTYQNSTDLLFLESLEDSLNRLNKEKKYFPLPSIPYNIKTSFENVLSPVVINEIEDLCKDENSYNIIFIDICDDYDNLDLSSVVKQRLSKYNNYHLYVRSDLEFIEDDVITTYYADFKKLFNHDVIVNDELSILAKKVNEEYFVSYNMTKDNKEYIMKNKESLALNEWNSLDSFTMNSNYSASINLRVKLNLLGLDYIKDGKGENTDLIDKAYTLKDKYTYDDYFEESIRNGLLAIEHARWNAYHLLNGYLPLASCDITVKGIEKGKVKYINKNKTTKEHACLTTFKGLDSLSQYLADKSSEILNTKVSKDAHDYYQADEFLIKVSSRMLKEIGYSVFKKNNK